MITVCPFPLWSSVDYCKDETTTKWNKNYFPAKLAQELVRKVQNIQTQKRKSKGKVDWNKKGSVRKLISITR